MANVPSTVRCSRHVHESGGRAQTSSGSFEPLGVRGDRAYFSQLPFESVDMVTGNLNLSFTDLVVPGNAGMNVTIVRSMNFGGGATGPSWSVGPAGLPIALLGASAPAAGPWYVGVVMADGGRRAVPHQNGVDTYLLDNFMRVTLSSRTVELPNGWIATYETGTDLIEAELQNVHDPYGNSITAYWLSRPGPFEWYFTTRALERSASACRSRSTRHCAK